MSNRLYIIIMSRNLFLICETLAVSIDHKRRCAVFPFLIIRLKLQRKDKEREKKKKSALILYSIVLYLFHEVCLQTIFYYRSLSAIQIKFATLSIFFAWAPFITGIWKFMRWSLLRLASQPLSFFLSSFRDILYSKYESHHDDTN